METETKVDKRTKEYKLSEKSQIDQLKEVGIPLTKAVFHRTVVNRIDGQPESAFFSSGAKKQRVANLWATPHYILVEQNGKCKLIPLANCSDTDVLLK